jgi:hypothetical protein
MKKENAAVADSVENPSERQTSAGSGGQESKSAGVRKDKKDIAGVQLPVLVEFTYTMSSILLIFLALTMIGISFVTGASLLHLVVRTSVAILVMGGLLMLVSSQISTGVMSGSLVEQEEPHKTQTETFENSAGTDNHNRAEA